MTDLEGLVKASYRAFNERDQETLKRIYTPDALWDGSHFPGFPRERYIGHEGIFEFIDEWWEMWEEFEVTPAAVEPGPKGLFVRGRLRMRARDELELTVEIGQVVNVREDGRIAAVYNYTDPDEARREAGL